MANSVDRRYIPPMSLSKRLKDGSRHGTLAMSVMHRLKRLGIDCAPYVLYEEDIAAPIRMEQDERLSYEIIDESMVESIDDAFPDEKRIWTKTWYHRLSGGELGLLARFDDDIVGFCWANMESVARPSGKFLFATEEKQCYLHDMVVAKKFRGMRLASMMRQEQFKKLVDRGLERAISASMYFNTPARKFRRELNARELELRCELNLFSRFDSDFRLRKYEVKR